MATEEMMKPPELPDLTRRLRKLDRHMVALLAQRFVLNKQVADAAGDSQRLEMDARRLQEVQGWALESGVDAELAKAFISVAMGSPSEDQTVRQQNDLYDNDALNFGDFRKNLLNLTDRIAPTYDNNFDTNFFATQSYRRFESALIDQVVAGLNDRSSALDLGCATGAYACRLSFLFSRVVGYDISKSMIDHACISPRDQREGTLSFKVADLDEGIPENDSSAAFILMNLGTASDMKDAGALLTEVHRVLKPGGKAVLSFYNSDALVFKCNFIPWALSLAAEMNPRRRCLDVHFGHEVFSIHAKAYTLSELERLLPAGLDIKQGVTYPTISSILPNEFFGEETVHNLVEDIDVQLRTHQQGNYLLVVCEKI
jgi:ubiquinone/menaquinone biosynthesis C-methylase UbiE/chorismate mutase